MMICEKCEKELSTSVGACPTCGYNPVLQRMDDWREKRTQKLIRITQGKAGRGETTGTAARGPRASAKDATLIRFPQRTAAPPQPAPQPVAVEAVPAWKERLNLRLQEIREQREPAPASQRVAATDDRNPIIVNALNRIQRANYLQPITPLPVSRSAAAMEFAPAPVEEVIPIPFVEAKTAPTTTIITRIPTARLPQVSVEAWGEIAPPTMVAEDELLSEINYLNSTPTVSHSEHDILETEAPTTTHTSLEAASLTKRVAAAVIDAEIIASSLLPLFGAYFFLSGWVEAPTIYLPILVAVLLITAYYFVTYAWAGRTMGMAWCNLHLASLSRTPEWQAQAAPTTITFTVKQAILRALGGTISLLLFPLNIICIIRSDERLSISDYLSETQVVRIRK